MEPKEIRELILRLAQEMVALGPGYGQQSAVLAEAKKRIPDSDVLRVQQLILTCWHDLFLRGDLAWGYNLDNPGAPFYHLPSKGSSGLPRWLDEIPNAR